MTLRTGSRLNRTISFVYETHGDPTRGEPFSVVPRTIEHSETETPAGAAAVAIRHIQTAFGYDDFDNETSSERKALLAGSTRTVTTTYDNLTGPWLIGLPRSRIEIDSVVGGDTTTRSAAISTDPGTGLLVGFTLEPGGAAGLSKKTTIVRNRDGLSVATIDTDLTTGISRENDISWDPVEGMFPRTISNSLGQVEVIEYLPALGVVARLRRTDGFTTRWTYDRFGREIAMLPDDGASVFTGYTLSSFGGLEVSVHAKAGNTITTAHDGLARERTRTSRNFDGTKLIREDTAYDVFFLESVALHTKPYEMGASPIFQRFQYDEAGRLARKAIDGGPATLVTYSGLRTTTIDPVGDIRYLEKDELDRPVLSAGALVDDESGGSHEIVTRYGYGPFDLLETTTDALGNVIRATYDRRGRRHSLEDRDFGVIRFNYDALGQLTEQVDGRPSTTRYGYDSLGRLIGARTSDGTSCYYHDGTPQGTGKPHRSVSPDHVERLFEYDDKGRVTNQRWRVARNTLDVGFGYDSSTGQLNEVRYPAVGATAGPVVRYMYSSTGALANIVDPATPSPPYWSLRGRDASNRLVEETFANGLSTFRHYNDTLGVLDHLTTGSGSTKVIDFGYEHFADGTLKTQTNLLALSSSPHGNTESFEYDSLKRLNAWFNPGRWNVTYQYSDIGNIVRRAATTSADVTMYSYGASAGPHAVTAATTAGVVANYRYDGVGNQIVAPSRRVDFTAFNLPRTISSPDGDTSFAYDADGIRVERTVSRGRGTTVYAGGFYELRTTAGRREHVFYVMGPDRPIAQLVWREVGGVVVHRSVDYLHDDRLGSVAAVTDGTWSTSRHPLERQRFDPFGRPISPDDPMVSTTPVGTRVTLGYTGHESDSAAGLVNMWGRIYDPTLGRFVSPDPIVPKPLWGQSLNRYSYVENDPINHRDPSGLAGDDIDIHGGGPDFLSGQGGFNGNSWPAVPNGGVFVGKQLIDCISAPECGRRLTKYLGGFGVPLAGIRRTTTDDSGARADTPSPPPWGFPTCGALCSRIVGEAFVTGWKESGVDQIIAFGVKANMMTLALAVPYLRVAVAGGMVLSISNETELVDAIPAIAMMPGLPKGIPAFRSAAAEATGGGRKLLTPGLQISEKQFGKKIGKHAVDFGLNPGSAADRSLIRSRIEEIAGGYSELRQGVWRGGSADYLFYREGADVVVTTPAGEFVTVLAGGAGNGYFKGASRIYP